MLHKFSAVPFLNKWKQTFLLILEEKNKEGQANRTKKFATRTMRTTIIKQDGYNDCDL